MNEGKMLGIRQRYQKEVQDFLKKEYPNDENPYFSRLTFKSTYLKSMRKTDLKYFHKLFAEHNEHFDVVLWNSLDDTFGCEGALLKNFDEKEFSEEERAFVEKFYTAFNEEKKYSYILTSYHYPNPNAGIETERLLLRELTVEDYLELDEKLRSEGDFVMFGGGKKKPTTADVKYCLPSREAGFALENKQTKELMGYVSLDLNTEVKKRVGKFGWYLFKKFRGNGYMEEALSALKDKAFAGELKISYETERRLVFGAEPVEIDIVRVVIVDYDKESIETAQKAGLQRECTLHSYRYDSGIGPVDVEIYYAKNPNIIKK